MEAVLTATMQMPISRKGMSGSNSTSHFFETCFRWKSCRHISAASPVLAQGHPLALLWYIVQTCRGHHGNQQQARPKASQVTRQ